MIQLKMLHKSADKRGQCYMYNARIANMSGTPRSERTVRRWADKKIIKAKVLPSGHRRFDEKEINKIKQGA